MADEEEAKTKEVDVGADLAEAVRRAEIEQRIAGVLHGLSVADRRAVRAVLLDVLMSPDVGLSEEEEATLRAVLARRNPSA